MIPWLPQRKAFAKAFCNAYQDVKTDLKSIRWGRGLRWWFAFCWAAGLLIFFVILFAFNSPRLYYGNACFPDGSFRLSAETYRIWSSSGFFQITMAVGDLSFTQAKVIDIAFDIVIGRGGQLLIAIFSWRVFARYIAACLEVDPITYQLFRTVFLENEASLQSSYRTIRSFIKCRRLRSKTAMVFITYSMLLIMAFPTISSAMSGYDSNLAAFVPDEGGTLIPFHEFQGALYVVHDGWRIQNFSGNELIGSGKYPSGDVFMPFSYECYKDDVKCFPLSSVRLYVQNYGLGGLGNETSKFGDPNYRSTHAETTLPGPVLNISACNNYPSNLNYKSPSVPLLPRSWMRENRTFEERYFDDARCQSTGTFKWGFSFLQLAVCIVLLFVWTVGLYIMWLKAHFTLKLRGRDPDGISGPHRAVIELAAAMQCELHTQDIDPFTLSEKELKETVEKRLRGGAISYAYSATKPQMYSMRKGTWSWVTRMRWWVLLIFIQVILLLALSLSAFNYHDTNDSITLLFWVWSWFTFGGLILALIVGNTTGSRIFVMVFWDLVTVFICIAIFFGYFRP